MHEIEKWFAGNRDYNRGILLYSKYGQHRSVESLLRSMPESRTSRELLEDHLKRIITAAPKHEPAPEPPKATIAKPSAVKKKIPVLTDLQFYKDAANKLYAQMGAEQARLPAYATDAERATASGRFLRLQAEWAEAQYRADVLEETGELPTEPLYKAKEKKKTKVTELSGSDYKKLTTLRSKVSRAEREQIPAYQSNPKYAAKLKKRLAEVAEWKSQIAQLEGGSHAE